MPKFKWEEVIFSEIIRRLLLTQKSKHSNRFTLVGAKSVSLKACIKLALNSIMPAKVKSVKHEAIKLLDAEDPDELQSLDESDSQWIKKRKNVVNS